MVLKVKPIPVPLDHDHPEHAHYPILPKHEFSMILCAPKGSGKTTFICNMLMDFYKGYFHNVVIFSPTLLNDDKWDVVRKTRDLLLFNKPYFRWKVKQRRQELANVLVANPLLGEDEEPRDDFEKQIKQLEKQHTGKIPKENFIVDPDEFEAKLRKCLAEQKKVIEELGKYGKSKHLANRILFIFDDMIGSSLFGNQRKNVFKMFNANHRHSSASILMVTQAYKEIPKTVRTNVYVLVFYRNFNQKEKEVIYEENGGDFTQDEFMQLFDYATSDDYSFLYINNYLPRGQRFMKNFEEVLGKGPSSIQENLMGRHAEPVLGLSGPPHA